MNWLKYLGEANLYLVAFYALYYIIFRRETWYQLNRAYLLACTVLAFVIPVIQVGILSPPDNELEDVVVTVYSHASARHHWLFSDYILAGYGLIVLLLLINLSLKIYRLIRLSHTNRVEKHPTYRLIELRDENNAFSFFNYLFISSAHMGSPTIIKHELVHIRQKHSWDIIYLEVLKAFNWFNPVIWLMQNSMKEVHEFIADHQSVNSETNAEQYTDFLVGNAYGINQNILTNTFFNKNLLKKRITMLHQKRSGNAARLKYLLIAPLILGMLCASTLAFAKTYGWIDLAPKYSSSAKFNGSDKTNKNRRLKVIMGGNSFITDKIAFKNNKGESKVYTVNSLTEQDKEFLLTSQNVKIEVVEVAGTSAPVGRLDLSDTLKKRKMVKRSVDSVNRRVDKTVNKEIGSAKSKYSAIPPPPPPVPPVKVKSGPKVVRIPDPVVPVKTAGEMKIKRPPPPPPRAPDITIDEPEVKKAPPPPPAPPDSTHKNN